MVGIGRRYEGADGSIMGRAEVSGESRRYPVDGADLGEVHVIFNPRHRSEAQVPGVEPTKSRQPGEVVPLIKMNSHVSM